MSAPFPPPSAACAPVPSAPLARLFDKTRMKNFLITYGPMSLLILTALLVLDLPWYHITNSVDQNNFRTLNGYGRHNNETFNVANGFTHYSLEGFRYGWIMAGFAFLGALAEALKKRRPQTTNLVMLGAGTVLFLFTIGSAIFRDTILGATPEEVAASDQTVDFGMASGFWFTLLISLVIMAVGVLRGVAMSPRVAWTPGQMRGPAYGQAQPQGQYPGQYPPTPPAQGFGRPYPRQF